MSNTSQKPEPSSPTRGRSLTEQEIKDLQASAKRDIEVGMKSLEKLLAQRNKK